VISEGPGSDETTTTSEPPRAETEGEVEQEASEEERGGSGILGRTVGAILGVGTAREAGELDEEEDGSGTRSDAVEAEETETGEPAVENGSESVADEPADQPETVSPTDAGDRIDLNSATFEDLRDVGFSVTQATRVITYRERQSGFSSLDDLADVQGMPRTFLSEIKDKLTV
jgi:competence ComEA-like helix-hairpin-helix protein